MAVAPIKNYSANHICINTGAVTSHGSAPWFQFAFFRFRNQSAIRAPAAVVAKFRDKNDIL